MPTYIKKRKKKDLADIRSIQSPSEKTAGKTPEKTRFLKPEEDYISMAEARKRGFKTEAEKSAEAIAKLKGPIQSVEFAGKKEAEAKPKSFMQKVGDFPVLAGSRKVLGTLATGIPEMFGADVTQAKKAWGLGEKHLWADPDVYAFAGTLAAAGILGALWKSSLVVGGGRAVITRTAFKHELVSSKLGGTRLVGRGAITTQRAFQAQAAKLTPQVDKLFKGGDWIGIKTLLSGGWKKAAVGGVIGMNGIMAWLASDNVLTGISFTVRNIGKEVEISEKYSNGLKGLEEWKLRSE